MLSPSDTLSLEEASLGSDPSSSEDRKAGTELSVDEEGVVGAAIDAGMGSAVETGRADAMLWVMIGDKLVDSGDVIEAVQYGSRKGEEMQFPSTGDSLFPAGTDA
jgi:hypothetical protein